MPLYLEEFLTVAAPPPDPGGDPNPIPAETTVRYASPTGGGNGESVGSPWSLSQGSDWINADALDGGTLRLLPGTYSAGVTSTILNDTRDLGVGAWRIIRAHDLNDKPILTVPVNGDGFTVTNGANRLCFYGLIFDGECTNVLANVPRTPPGSDGGQHGLLICGYAEAGTTQHAHHVWAKQCVFRNWYTAGIASNGGYGVGASEFYLVEDCEFYDNAKGPHWGGSATSILFPTFGIADEDVDPRFKPTIDGSEVICGFIFRRNIGYRNFQVNESDSGTTMSDGNMVTTDFWNHDDYEVGEYQDLGPQDYPRAALLECNISFGNGRFYAATYTHPAGGVYVRFNTSSHDGITYRHVQFGTSTEASNLGGKTAGGWNDVFRVDANALIYDPAMNNTAATHQIVIDGYTGGNPTTPTNPCLRADWNLISLAAGAVIGSPIDDVDTNTVLTDPSLGDPPDYLNVTGGPIALATIESWATPSVGSSAYQTGQTTYAPESGVDIFWNTHDGTTLGAVAAV